MSHFKPLRRPAALFRVFLAYYWSCSSSLLPVMNPLQPSVTSVTSPPESSSHLFLLTQRRSPATKNCTCYLCLLLLVTSVGINPNPSPPTSLISHSLSSSVVSTYPCGTCHKHLSWEDRAVSCEECYCWYHIDLHNI